MRSYCPGSHIETGEAVTNWTFRVAISQRARRIAARLHLVPADHGGSRAVIDAFHRHWYRSKVWKKSVQWEGVPLLKNPLDMWMYQQIIWDTKPDLIIETGSFRGGSALFFGRILDAIGNGEVLSIDINEIPHEPIHPRVRFLTGSSVDARTLTAVSDIVQRCERVMVILDSDHRYDHVRAELSAYERFVTVGGYLVVEDTNVNGHPVAPAFGPGPMEAVKDFLKEHGTAWSRDESCERFLMTFNPSGWLVRVAVSTDPSA